MNLWYMAADIHDGEVYLNAGGGIVYAVDALELADEVEFSPDMVFIDVLLFLRLMNERLYAKDRSFQTAGVAVRRL